MNVGTICGLKESKREHTERRFTCKQVLLSLSPACKRENEWGRERKKKFSAAKRFPYVPFFLQLLPPSCLNPTLPDAISLSGLLLHCLMTDWYMRTPSASSQDIDGGLNAY